MMRRTLLGAAAVAILLQLGSSRPLAAQGFSSLAAAAAAASSTALEKQPGCWQCISLLGFGVCQGGNVPGYWNCTGTSMAGTCSATSPGCGGAAMMPLDPDGAPQLVSRGSLLGIKVSGTEDVRRNCDGVVVARLQSPDDIASIRNRTGTLTL